MVKIAEALAERSDCQRRIEDLKQRLVKCARIQEGDQPAEDPAALPAEADRVFDRLQQLITSINRTNAATPLAGRRTIADAIAERDILGQRRDLFAKLAEAASTRQDRYSKSEVKFVAAVSVADVQKRKDQLAKEFRELDTRIQELNWKTDMV